MKSELMKLAEDQLVEKRNHPVFKAGDTVTVNYRIVEGNKERLQAYQGVVLQRAGSGIYPRWTAESNEGCAGEHNILHL